jgi:quercetin dioxygenase-like cupin family protein
MNVKTTNEVAEKPVTMPGSSACTIRWLVGKEDQAANFAMRKFKVEPGGYTPRHSHPYEHEIYVLSGEGVVFEGDRQHRLAAGSVVYVKPGEVHQFRNTGEAPFEFLCLVPNASYTAPIHQAPECGG